MTWTRRCTGVAMAMLGLLTGGLMLTASPAMAAHIPAVPPTLPACTGGFSVDLGLAVGPAGEVFVSNTGSSFVDVYSSSGVCETEFKDEVPVGDAYQMAVDDSSAAGDPSKGDIYVASLAGYVEKYEYNRTTKTATKLAKIEGEGLTEPTAVAVDPRNGDVYVADFMGATAGAGYVNEYGPEGKLIAKELGEMKGLTKPGAMVVDSSGHIFVGTQNGVLEYEENGTCMNLCAAFGGETAHTDGLAVGPEGDVYVGNENANAISVFDSTGKEVETFTTGIGEPLGIGVSGTTVYVTNLNGNEVKVFVLVPTLTITPAGNGTGNVECEVEGSGFEPCLPEYNPGAKLIIEGVAEKGSEFQGWSGGKGSASTCAGKGNCKFEITEASAVTATFLAVNPSALKIETEGTGTGTVECKVDSRGFEPCLPLREYGEGAELEVRAAQAFGSVFEEWSVASGSAKLCLHEKGVCKFEMKEASALTALFAKKTLVPLTVAIYGKGEVKSSPPGGVECPGKCSAEVVEGPTTLTEKAETGYEFAGWFGCVSTGETTCEVSVTTPTVVTALFIKAAATGPTGPEGPPGPEGPTGPEGEKGEPGEKGATGAKGTQGEKGAVGANGAQGPAGANGAQGPAGANGAQGPAGPAGQIELVTCKKSGKKQKCTTKLVTGPVKFTTKGLSAHATLSRHGAVYATGTASTAGGRLSLRLTPLRNLRAGRYTLTLISGSGRHTTIRSESFTLR